MLLCRLRVSMLAIASSLMCLGAFFLGSFCDGGSTMLGARDEASDTELKSLKPMDVGGVGKLISASLDAVRRRRCELNSRDELDLVLSDGTPMTPLSTTVMS